MPLILAAALASAALAGPPRPAKPQTVALKTADGWTLSARWLDAGRKAPAVVLAHGVGSASAEWNRLADALQQRGVSTLALDLRGHGDSRRGPKGESGPERFDSTGEWSRAHEDLRAGAHWLEKNRRIKSERIGLGGASIGANLASRAAAERPKTPFLVLLSAGADYHGVAPVLRPGMKTLAAAAADDRYAFDALQRLGRAGVETLECPSGHGVQMFDDPASFERIVDWIVRAADAK